MKTSSVNTSKAGGSDLVSILIQVGGPIVIDWATKKAKEWFDSKKRF